MVATYILKNKNIFSKIRKMSNEKRFRILELVSDKKLSISKLSSYLNLTYTKCSDYVKLLQDQGLITKTKKGKNVLVSGKVIISDNKVIFN